MDALVLTGKFRNITDVMSLDFSACRHWAKLNKEYIKALNQARKR
jgi:hypothetical protein